jgi:hypothetical protein
MSNKSDSLGGDSGNQQGDAFRIVFRKTGGSYEPPKVLDTDALSGQERAELDKA